MTHHLADLPKFRSWSRWRVGIILKKQMSCRLYINYKRQRVIQYVRRRILFTLVWKRHHPSGNIIFCITIAVVTNNILCLVEVIFFFFQFYPTSYIYIKKKIHLFNVNSRKELNITKIGAWCSWHHRRLYLVLWCYCEFKITFIVG